MDTRVYIQFFEALEQIINEDEPAIEKAKNLKSAMNEGEITLIEELISWFDDGATD